jgi:hypothetical protein
MMVSIVEECKILTIFSNQEPHLLAVATAKLSVRGAGFDSVLPNLSTLVVQILTGQ